MGFKSQIAKVAASVIAPAIYREQKNAIAIQERMILRFIRTQQYTDFGREHRFLFAKDYDDYRHYVPVRNYEDFEHYLYSVQQGRSNVLWMGTPLYFCKTSGTTSGTKYIPITHAQVNEMIRAARNSLLLYVAETGKADFFDHKMIFLQGSPELDMHGTIRSGRLSGIVYHHVPSYAQSNRMPSYEVNCIEDWEQKVEAIAKETVKERMGLISGIPPWVLMYFNKLRLLTGKQYIKDIFPDFRIFAFGGVNYEPYRQQIENAIGFPVDSVETYPASEGFIAFQDSQKAKGLLLNINGGIFYEFIKEVDFRRGEMKRITLRNVEPGVNYVLVITTNAGLWSYNIGDTIKFTSLDPYRIVVTGRIKQFISAFGEHVIVEEVEAALKQAVTMQGGIIADFTVAPQVKPSSGLPHHQWFIAFEKQPENLNAFSEQLDNELQKLNSYYRDLREGNILRRLETTVLTSDAFVRYMKTQGKLGGQNKVPRLMNDRSIADQLSN